MMLWLTGLYVRPTATNKARLNSPDFKFTKTYGALFEMSHDRILFLLTLTHSMDQSISPIKEISNSQLSQ